MIESDTARFWSKVDIGTSDACWPWKAYRDPNGYGRVGVPRSRKIALAHRVALAMSGVIVPPNANVCHRCDNPPCCNPAHLVVGDQGVNMRHCAERDRTTFGRRSTNAKLSDEQAREIRVAAAGGETQRSLASRFSVSQSTVHSLIHRVTWRRVDG